MDRTLARISAQGSVTPLGEYCSVESTDEDFNAITHLAPESVRGWHTRTLK
jgi:hypothetical protein